MLPELPPSERKLIAEWCSYGELVNALFELVADPAFAALYRTADNARRVPVFVTEYPVEASPLGAAQ